VLPRRLGLCERGSRLRPHLRGGRAAAVLQFVGSVVGGAGHGVERVYKRTGGGARTGPPSDSIVGGKVQAGDARGRAGLNGEVGLIMERHRTTINLQRYPCGRGGLVTDVYRTAHQPWCAALPTLAEILECLQLSHQVLMAEKVQTLVPLETCVAQFIGR